LLVATAMVLETPRWMVMAMVKARLRVTEMVLPEVELRVRR
jgi:hypothetical protein